MPTIDLPPDLYAKLGQLAQPFIDKPADVVQRLLDAYQSASAGGLQLTPPQVRTGARDIALGARRPRERGANVEVAGHMINADSVRDLFEQVLRVLSQNGNLDRVKGLVPFKTSSRRYLIAKQPVHPNGNRFVVPVEHGGLHMEAHKSYHTALTQLQHFLSKCGVSLRYVG